MFSPACMGRSWPLGVEEPIHTPKHLPSPAAAPSSNTPLRPEPHAVVQTCSNRDISAPLAFGQTSCRKPFACRSPRSLCPHFPMLQPKNIPRYFIYAVHKNTWQCSSVDIHISLNNHVPPPNYCHTAGTQKGDGSCAPVTAAAKGCSAWPVAT